MDKETREQIDRIHRRLMWETGKDDHFYVCPICGQTVDRHSLPQVLHHQGYGHRPMTQKELSRLG